MERKVQNSDSKKTGKLPTQFQFSRSHFYGQWYTVYGIIQIYIENEDRPLELQNQIGKKINFVFDFVKSKVETMCDVCCIIDVEDCRDTIGRHKSSGSAIPAQDPNRGQGTA